MESKIRGVEQELAMNTIPVLPHSSLIYLVGMAMEELKKKELLTSIKVEEERLDFMALNGFRVYNDMSHLELSSPSYNTPIEAVIYDKVAELFALYAVQGLRRYFKEVNVYKNNVSALSSGKGEWKAVSYSTHSSIILSRNVCNPEVWDEVEEALIPYMVTRILLIGGGDFVPILSSGDYNHYGKELHGETLGYTISPRAVFVKKISSNDTVDARGLLNQRDDPHADPRKYWRLHDINWEGLRSPYQIYLRDCLETLVMIAYEEGFLKNPPRLEDPIHSIKNLSSDTEKFDWKVPLENGRNVDALSEILEGYYLAKIEEMLSAGVPNQIDRMAFNLIEATIQGLNERRLEYFIDGLDWITKKFLVDEYAPNSLEDALAICNQYTLLDRSILEYLGEKVEADERQTTFSWERSLDFAKDAIPIVDWDGMSKMVNRALVKGPDGTREYFRCLVAREFPFLVESIEWERVKFSNTAILLEEPFKFNKEMCGEKLEEATENMASFMQAITKLDLKAEPVMRSPHEDHEVEGKR